MENFLTAFGGWLPLVYALVPLLVGLIYKASASASVKSLAMIFVTGLATLAEAVASQGGILDVATAQTWVFGIVIAVSTHYGVWKNIEVGNGTMSNLLPEAGLVGPKVAS